jgi:hypothetical protein
MGFLLIFSPLLLGASYGPTGIIVSGGQEMAANNGDFLADLDRAALALQGWNLSFFYADGGDKTGPPNIIATDAKGNTLTTPDGLYPTFTRGLPDVPVNGPAELTTIQSQINDVVAKMSAQGDATSPVVLYFTDHGSHDSKTGNSEIELWDDQSISVDQMRSMIASIPSTHPVELIDDHCYGAGMSKALYDDQGKLRPNACTVSPAGALETSSTGQSFMAVAQEISDSNVKSKEFDMDGDGNISAHEVIFAMSKLRKMNSLPTSSSDTFAYDYLAKLQQTKNSQSPSAAANSCPPTSTPQDVSKLISPDLQVVLDKELDMYNQDLGPALAALKSKSISLDDLRERTEKAKADLLNEMALAKTAGHNQALAMRAFLTVKVGQANYDSYQAQAKGIDKLYEALDVAKTPAEIADLRSQIAAANKALEPLNLQLSQVFSGLDKTNPEFLQYVKEKGGTPPALFQKDVIKEAAKADKAVYDGESYLRSLIRATRDLTTVTAVKTMESRGDSDAMSSLLGLLECENTPLFKGKQ